MENLVPLGTGNSRFMKSNISPSTTLAQLIQMLNNGTFPYDIGPINPAGISQQGDPINKDTLLKDATAGLYGLGSDAVPDDVLSKLSKSILIGLTPKYEEVTINLSNVVVGQVINLPYNGKMVGHRVVHIGNPDANLYDSSCNGVWILREDLIENTPWDSSGGLSFPDSTLMEVMEGYLTEYGNDIQSAIKTVKIPYCAADRSTINSGANGLECKLFPLSGYEVGENNSDVDYLPVDGAKLDYFLTRGNGGVAAANQQRIANLNGEPGYWWLRSISLYTARNLAFTVYPGGTIGHITTTYETSATRPAFIMPTTFTATYYVDSEGNIHEQQEYEEGGNTTDVQGNPITIGTQIATGSYVGTGTYGASNPNTLTFDFEPKLVLIANMHDGVSSTIFSLDYEIMVNPIEWMSGGYTSSSNSSYNNKVTWSGNEVSWYGTGNFSNMAYLQKNESGTTFYYIAIA